MVCLFISLVELGLYELQNVHSVEIVILQFAQEGYLKKITKMMFDDIGHLESGQLV